MSTMSGAENDAPTGGGADEPPLQAAEARPDLPPDMSGVRPLLKEPDLDVLRRYGSEQDVEVGDVLFADGDETYDLIVVLDGKVDIVEGYGQPSEVAIVNYGPLEFLGEIGLLTGQRAYLTAVARTPGRVLRIPTDQVRLEAVNGGHGALAPAAHLAEADETLVRLYLDDRANEPTPVGSVRMPERRSERDRHGCRANIGDLHVGRMGNTRETAVIN